MSNHQFYNYKQLADILKINRLTLINRVYRQRKYVASGADISPEQLQMLAPPSIKIGRNVLFRTSLVDEWMQKFELNVG